MSAIEFAETLNFYISDAENGISRVPHQKLVEIQEELRRLAALAHPQQAAPMLGDARALFEHWAKQPGQDALARHLKFLVDIEEMIDEGQGDDEGAQGLPAFEPGISVLAKVEKCLFLLEKRRDVIAAYGDERLFDADAPMADGEIKMTAAEEVLVHLIINVIGVLDDQSYTPNDAQRIIEATLATPEAGTSEPVAEPFGCVDKWQQNFASAKTHAIGTLIAKGWTPLYTHPAPAPADGEAVRALLSRLIYPVDTSINPRGWELREEPMIEEAVRYIQEALAAAPSARKEK
jgi:hypothetical protein